MDARQSQLLIDMDKGADSLGPLFEESSRRMQDEPAFRAAWGRYQALRALAWEATPELDERLMRQGLQASRRQDVERRLARTAGSQDAARELLLDEPRAARSGGLPVWVSGLLLIGALGLGWMAFGPGSSKTTLPDAVAVPTTAAADGPLAFEFPVQTPPASAALDNAAAPANDETRSDPPAARQARRMVNEHLRTAAAPVTRPTAVPTQAPTPLPTATTVPTALPTAIPTQAPTAAPAVQAPVSGAPQAEAAIAAPEASLTLSSSRFPASASLSLPDASHIDLRLFDMRGRLVHRYADAEQAAGTWRFDLPATNEQGQPLPHGSYYLRVITRWFSKVEPLEQP